MSVQRVLLIESDRERAEGIRTVLEFLEYEVVSHGVADACDDADELSSFCAVMVGTGGEKLATVIKTLKENLETLPIVLIVNRGAAFQIPSALDDLVHSVQEWPTRYAVLTETFQTVRRARLQNRESSRSLELFRSLGGDSQVIQKTRKLIKQVADTEAIVLILGESGTGKEVVARNLHYHSTRRRHPFVPVNCGAIPSELLESELFGHEKGAFSGALSTRQGRFEMAEGGTLFLDEIGDMPLAMQVKILRVLQERTFERVGSNKTIKCNVRIIAATHRNLEQEIKEGRFREDLFYRLNVFPIVVPALRERAGDIPVLVSDLITRIENENRGTVRFKPAAFRAFMHYGWPGNVRELANLIERLTILHPHGVVDVEDLPEKFQNLAPIETSESEQEIRYPEYMAGNGGDSESISQLPEQGLDLREHLNQLECDLIRQALGECDGIVAHAAKLLKMRRTTLVEKMRKYEIQRSDDMTVI